MTTAKKEITNLQPVITELHKVYDKANQVLFKGELPAIVITMQSRGNRKGVLGWFVTQPIWEAGEDKELYEINIVPEAMKRDYTEILQTLIHEMVHVYCAVKGIKETSRGGAYHNKKFKETAEMFGLEYTHEAPDSKIGYSAVTLKKETLNMLKFWNINKEAFKIARKEFGGQKEKKKTNIIKWVCPSCGDIIRSSKPTIKAYCMNDVDAEGNEKEPCATMFEPEL